MSSQSAAKLRSRYVEQVASELAENRRRQEELASRIELLRQEETLLTDILELAERYEGFADASRLPEQAQDGSAAAHTPVRDVPARAAARARGGAGSRARGPLLGDVLLELLAGHDEPCAAKELREELLERHPDRTPTPQVVRNTLESLVAKGRVERAKRERSVVYTALDPADAG
ncbi:hypothetical protein ACFWXK_03020 [Streptomyces sp. NPDC059070]|uniref:hypothetical protein n=1 Tax=unclassified Streptomyces TaxID=2593676 RepID=UPI0034E264E1